MAGSWGKFGEDEGGLEGEGTPSERGGPSPSKVFYPLISHTNTETIFCMDSTGMNS